MKNAHIMGEPHLLEMYLVILLFNSVEQISIVNRVVAMAKRFLTRVWAFIALARSQALVGNCYDITSLVSAQSFAFHKPTEAVHSSDTRVYENVLRPFFPLVYSSGSPRALCRKAYSFAACSNLRYVPSSPKCPA